MEKTIYVLIDCGGDIICAFCNGDQAEREAKECGCYVVELTLHPNE